MHYMNSFLNYVRMHINEYQCNRLKLVLLHIAYVDKTYCQHTNYAYLLIYPMILIRCHCFILPSSDLDECEENTDICPDHSTCSNLVGGYLCTCNEGFYWVGTHSDPLYTGMCEGMLNTKLCLHLNKAIEH